MRLRNERWEGGEELVRRGTRANPTSGTCRREVPVGGDVGRLRGLRASRGVVNRRFRVDYVTGPVRRKSVDVFSRWSTRKDE